MADGAAPAVVQWLGAVGAIATPVLLGIASAVGWSIKKRADERRAAQEEERNRIRNLEEELREDRLKLYEAILEPFMVAFTKDEWLAREPQYKGRTKEQALQSIILSLSYRRTGFRLSLFANDDVMHAYNRLMQFFYQAEARADASEAAKSTIALFGDFLLAIRKSVGNETTTLTRLEMLEWMISDVRNLGS